MQALFRKIAAALPGMETTSITREDKDIHLKPPTNTPQTDTQGRCVCWWVVEHIISSKLLQ